MWCRVTLIVFEILFELVIYFEKVFLFGNAFFICNFELSVTQQLSRSATLKNDNQTNDR